LFPAEINCSLRKQYFTSLSKIRGSDVTVLL
jgi:hypothetical protein